MTENTALPTALAEIVDDFTAVPDPEKLELLLEFSDELPELPARYDGHEEEMEQVVECQSPLFLAVEIEGEPAGGQSVMRLFITAPPEAPTTRGFASVLSQGLDGLTAAEILGVPDDIPNRLGLAQALTPLRLRGMSAMLGRIKRNVRDLTAEG
ncbi:SufE family protein [Micrococcus lylae]|uniref:SufE family protein n=1 Tax=Micrococcus lylae TaxID=1273 RepID=A0A1R4IE38_9MICC|nr:MULTISPECIES: SufE family protein [Micrococcus]MCT2007299.1 SufE family protein [Micrococcus lylae]MCT2071027.1 SufE family protein [Micrococcus lylae]PNL17932.1 cysteine desulfuration protein SufE [Micrococcus sp. FDAARGOS_333]TFI00877.1 SufE family protein [Micrococcus lylae]WIK82807.1 SufE family protein [Micrococcus lylae]